MFLRVNQRKKNGKLHRYWSVMESRRVDGGQPVQRQVPYLGEINDSQQRAWRKSISVFDEEKQDSRQVCLFPDDRPIPADEINALSLRMSEMRLERPRRFGDCWLGYQLWNELGLDEFWQSKLGAQRGEVPWNKVLQVLAINRLIDPASEFRVHRQWYLSTAMDELLGRDFAAAARDRLYRCLDRILEHKDELCQHLTRRWKTLFDANFDVLLYDLTSTYLEGGCQGIPKARHGYSRDGRPDCRQVVIALVVTTDGLPLAYEVVAGNTSDKTTLAEFLEKIQSMYGKARRVWVMDRGIPTHATLAKMREENVAYLVGTPRSTRDKLEQQLIDKPWERVHEGMKVKLLQHEGELYVLAASEDRRRKETAMRRRKLKALVHGLNRLRHAMGKRKVSRDYLLKKVAILRKEAGRVARFVKVVEPKEGELVNRRTFICTFQRSEWRNSITVPELSEYLIRAWLPEGEGTAALDLPADVGQQAPILWQWYMQLTQVEQAFKTLKSDLDLRPIHHQLEHRVEAHILVAFLGYCLSVTLRMKLKQSAPGLTPAQALESLSMIQMVQVEIPTTDGRTLILPRHTEPEAQQQLILQKLGLSLPPQPPPRIRAGQIELAESKPC